jgi:hypothetical protein
MGWLIAILLLIIAALLAFLLIHALQERASLVARIAALEPDATAGRELGSERDRLAAEFDRVRVQAKAMQEAHDDKARLLARCEAARTSLQAERDKLLATYEAVTTRMKGVLDADAERERVIADAKQIAEEFNAEVRSKTAKYETIRQSREAELADLEARLVPLRQEHQSLDEEASLRELGFYKSHYGFATSERYKKAIDENYASQKAMLRDKEAAVCSREWKLDGSVDKGKKLTDKYLTLMLRAFNGECDSVIAKVKPTNYQAMEARIQKAFETLNKLGEIYFCSISESYKDARIEELRLEHEHAMKLQAEREEQRAIKEEMRQQAIAAREIEKAQQEAEREEKQYEAALVKARAEFEKAGAAKQEEMQAKLAELEQMVAEAHANKERAISRAQQTRAGHVYVISNVGSFGSNVYKIGMTRRLDPMDRIWELSDASVPFDFDVHAIIYTNDAPSLEAELHERFRARRVNAINERKEYFYVTMDEIAQVVRERFGDIELTLAAEAAEFLQSVAFHRENGSPFLQQRLFSVQPTNPNG